MRRWRKKMASSSCVSTGIRRSRTFELLSWDYGSSRIPSLPGRSALSTGPPCAPSHRHYGRTGLVQAVTNAILPNNHRLLLFHPLEPRNDYVFDGTRLESVDTLLLSPTTISSSHPPPRNIYMDKMEDGEGDVSEVARIGINVINDESVTLTALTSPSSYHTFM